MVAFLAGRQGAGLGIGLVDSSAVGRQQDAGMGAVLHTLEGQSHFVKAVDLWSDCRGAGVGIG